MPRPEAYPYLEARVDAGLLDHYERVQLHESALVVALIALLVSLFTG